MLQILLINMRTRHILAILGMCMCVNGGKLIVSDNLVNNYWMIVP